jgi:hypothetical protein
MKTQTIAIATAALGGLALMWVFPPIRAIDYYIDLDGESALGPTGSGPIDNSSHARVIGKWDAGYQSRFCSQTEPWTGSHANSGRFFEIDQTKLIAQTAVLLVIVAAVLVLLGDVQSPSRRCRCKTVGVISGAAIVFAITNVQLAVVFSMLRDHGHLAQSYRDCLWSGDIEQWTMTIWEHGFIGAYALALWLSVQWYARVCRRSNCVLTDSGH